jgi:hypothetical protein
MAPVGCQVKTISNREVDGLVRGLQRKPGTPPQEREPFMHLLVVPKTIFTGGGT